MSEGLIVPTLCVGTHFATLRVARTRSVQHGIPTQSVGTIKCGVSGAYKIRTRNDLPLILPLFRRSSACLAMLRSTAT